MVKCGESRATCRWSRLIGIFVMLGTCFSRFQNRLLFLTRRNPFVAEKLTEQKQTVSSSNRFILELFITVFFYLCCLNELFIISGRLCFFQTDLSIFVVERSIFSFERITFESHD